MCSAHFKGPCQKAVLELPFVEKHVNANVLAAMEGMFVIMSIAATTRLSCERRRKNRAAVLLVGIVIASSCGMFCLWIEPMC